MGQRNEVLQKILPTFNRMVIFSTTDFSYHGNPEKLIVLKIIVENLLQCIIIQMADL